MPKLLCKELLDGATIKAAHMSHQSTLYFDLLIPAVDSLSEEELTHENDPFFSEVGPVMMGWAKEELCTIGFISVFHMWERQFRELLLEQRTIQALDIPSQRRGKAW